MCTSYEDDFRLRIGDFDQYGRLLPSSVLDMWQEVATIQANRMGIGRDAMLERGVIWVVVRTKLEVVAQPALHSIVRARTWPHSPSRISFYRDYTLADSHGDMLVKGTSEWVLVDVEKHAFASVADHYSGNFDLVEDRALGDKLRKIRDFDTEPSPIRTIESSFADIDLNGHVNNARYANYIIDAIGLKESDVLRTMQIDYRHEIVPGENVRIESSRDEGTAIVRGVDPAGTVKFASKVEFTH